MRRRIKNWLRTEYQRTVMILPRLITISIAIVVVMGILLKVGHSVMETRQEESKIKIGYVAEDDFLTKLLVSYVAGMDSVDEWCRFVAVTEKKGKERLQEGKLEALLILPDNVVDEILSGTNAPATLLLPKQSTALGIVFEELADAGIRMLSVAQGEIYTVYELADELELTEEQLLAMCDDINVYNLGLMKDREDWFEIKRLSITGNEGMAVYYGSAALTIYLLLCGVLFGQYIKHSEQEQLLMWKRIGIAPGVQVMGRILMIAMLLITALLPTMGLLALPWLRDMLMPVFTWQGIILILLSVICVACLLLLLYQVSEQYRAAVVLVGLVTVVQGYIAGCFLPNVLLPQVIQKISAYMPANYVRQAFSLVFSGELAAAGKIGAVLTLFSSCLIICNILVMYERISRHTMGEATAYARQKRKTKQVAGTLFGIYAKRLLHRKSFWCSLLVFVLVSVGLSHMEQESETELLAAFYDESGEWEESLCAYEGYIRFMACDNEAAVRELVLHNEVECGYVLAEDVTERLQQEDADGSIVVYEDSDALMTNTVNEIVFEMLFTELSREWFADYISDADRTLAVLQQKLTDGSTFSVQKEYWKTDMEASDFEKEKRTTYPVGAVIGVTILLCIWNGAWEAIEDYRSYHFFKRNVGIIVFINIFQPLFCGVIVSIMIFLYNSY